jgi:bifunctional DNA-binding transcriptional regulator/antitoxin component of YhaV-PrlF toxin-antitoxin module
MECIRTVGLKEGDELEAQVSATEIRLIPAPVFDKAQFLCRVRDLRARMPMTQPVVETMRREERY